MHSTRARRDGICGGVIPTSRRRPSTKRPSSHWPTISYASAGVTLPGSARDRSMTTAYGRSTSCTHAASRILALTYRLAAQWVVGGAAAAKRPSRLECAVSASALQGEWRDRPPGAEPDLESTIAVPQSPEWLVDRPSELTSIARAVRASTVVGITAAFPAAGGFGTTTLARAACADARIRKRFADRIFWVT